MKTLTAVLIATFAATAIAGVPLLDSDGNAVLLFIGIIGLIVLWPFVLTIREKQVKESTVRITETS